MIAVIIGILLFLFVWLSWVGLFPPLIVGVATAIVAAVYVYKENNR